MSDLNENVEENKEEKVINEKERSDEDLIKNNVLSTLGLNIDCENALIFMRQYAGGSSPEALFIMVSQLMNEYLFLCEKLEEQKVYEKSLEDKEKKYDRKLDKVKLKYKIKRKKYLIKRRKLLNKKLFKIFRKKILCDEVSSINKSKSELNEKKEETKVSSNNLKIETRQTTQRIKALNQPKKS